MYVLTSVLTGYGVLWNQQSGVQYFELPGHFVVFSLLKLKIISKYTRQSPMPPLGVLPQNPSDAVGPKPPLSGFLSFFFFFFFFPPSLWVAYNGSKLSDVFAQLVCRLSSQAVGCLTWQKNLNVGQQGEHNWLHRSYFFCVFSIDGEYVPKEGDQVCYRTVLIPPRYEKKQACHVVIKDLNPGVSHERWDSPVQREFGNS